jgi:iron(III) transport system permease protein
MSGANPRSTLRKVTMRLLLPGLLAVTIYQSMTALDVFEVPGVLGMPASIYVFSTKIYSILHTVNGLPNYGHANALAMIYVLIALVTTWMYARVIAHQERFSIISGKGYRPREVDLGKWRWTAFGGVFLFLMFSIILPFVVLLYVSFLPFLMQPSVAAFNHMSFEHYQELWDTPQMGRVLLNTINMVVITSTLTVVFSLIVSWVIVRGKFRGWKVLDQLAFLPHAIPGMVMGLAFLWLFLNAKRMGIDIHGGVLAISLAFSVGFMAYGTRSINAALLQIHRDLEEAAQVSGARQWRIMLRIFVPLMLPTLAGVWIWSMLHAVRIAGMPLLIYDGISNQVLAILIWNMWDEGNIEGVGAIGTLLILVLLAITLCLRLIGFGRSVSVQQTGH